MREDLIPAYQLKATRNEVLILDAESGETLSHIGGLSGPVAPFFDPDGSRIFVSSREDGTVRVYDGESYAPLQTIALPDHPNSFTYDAGRKALFVTIKKWRREKG
ncbi:hypothetical protein M3484_16440 [Pseudomonas sp. GX19020]|uniref:YncE family protein n=1 Tax=Pseudomonas sp. GX19020 TaxID=2942277 RepID=UPI0020191CC6|nr:hypothetical protein [Pseudomonas sp. GX19020]MCL4068161.1 hypothetical protein [Pseudomonas sp. GX19020]